MTPLNRILIRDLLRLRGHVIAITLVIACGVASFVSMRSTYRSLLLTQATYYERYRFADVFTQVKRAPEQVAAQISAIPGVASVQTRVVRDVTLDVPGLPEPAAGRLVSIPERQTPVLNDIFLRSGRYPEPGRHDEVLISEAFANANHLMAGAELGAVIGERWRKLRIVGVALSPEYVYEVRGAGYFFPDNKRFGILWMSREAMAPAFDMRGAFDDVSLTLLRGASRADVIDRLDGLLAPFGCLGAYGREDQISHRFLSDEIAQNRISANIVPGIFLAVAAFLLHIVLSRLLGIQRSQIGLLRAFGYANVEVGLHYLKLAFLAVAGGVALGTVAGLYFGHWLTEVYRQFYRFPLLRYETGAELFGLAILISFGSAAVGALSAVRGAASLPPADAMRPEPPAQFRQGLMERIGLQKLLPSSARMILRNIERRPGRAALSVLGIALAVGILVVGRYFYDAMNQIIQVQFHTAQRADVTISFVTPRRFSARFDVAHLPSTIHSEPFRQVAARLRFEHRSRRMGVLGLEPNSQLRRIVDSEFHRVALPAEGLVVTSKLAEILGLRSGDRVQVEVLEGARPVREVRVAALVDEPLGLSAYMDRRALNRLLSEGETISGAYLSVDPSGAAGLYALLKRTPAVTGVNIRKAEVESFQQIIAESLSISTDVLIMFACIIAMGMIYNGARIALSERGNELASLRVLGFTFREIAMLLLGEQAVITLLAIPCGLTLGYLVCALLTRSLNSELYRMPLVISPTTYAFAVLVVTTAAAASGLLVARKLRHLDLIAVLKTRE